jgi:hypothetical protein
VPPLDAGIEHHGHRSDPGGDPLGRDAAGARERLGTHVVLDKGHVEVAGRGVPTAKALYTPPDATVAFGTEMAVVLAPAAFTLSVYVCRNLGVRGGVGEL